MQRRHAAAMQASMPSDATFPALSPAPCCELPLIFETVKQSQGAAVVPTGVDISMTIRPRSKYLRANYCTSTSQRLVWMMPSNMECNPSLEPLRLHNQLHCRGVAPGAVAVQVPVHLPTVSMRPHKQDATCFILGKSTAIFLVVIRG